MSRGQGRDHIESADTMAEAAGSGEPAAALADAAVRPGELAPGGRVGRYVLLGTLGRGGMGQVYRAFDPKLDRQVGLKVVVARRSDSQQGGEEQARLVREAQAIAKVTHPNVVAVHDVGVAGDRVYIAMEYVPGVTLREWVRARSPGWREIATMYVQAGRGLAAAHAASLVHRDFKPENVLVGDDGRARVLDFGLARARFDSFQTSPTLTETAPGDDPEMLPSTPLSTPLNTPLTRAGAILGTPGYMAPEQYTGDGADERSDQFSFCVSLWEALYGERPFPGKTLGEVKERIASGVIAEPPRRSPVPVRVRQLLQRGLSVARDQRHASMPSLLADLERAIAPRRRVALVVAVAGVLVIGGSIVALRSTTPVAAPAVSPCQGGARKLAGIWDEPARAQLQAVFRDKLGARADATWARVAADLDRWSQAWTGKHQAVCEATRVHGEQSEAALDLRMRCLQRQLDGAAQLTQVMASGDAAVLGRAAVLTGRLPELVECDDVRALSALTPPPESAALAARVDDMDGRLARAKALSDAGKLTDARQLAEAVLAEARDVGYEPLLARAFYLRGLVDRLEGKGAEGKAAMFDAIVHAERAGDDMLRAQAAADLVFLVGYLQGATADGLAWGTLAASILARAGGRDSIEASLQNNTGTVYHEQERYAEAVECFERGRALREKVYGPDSFELVSSLNNLGSALTELGRNDEARRHLQRAEQILVALFGAVHPHRAAVLVNLGIAEADLGAYDAALEHHREALRIYEQLLGPEHTLLGAPLVNAADVLSALRRFDEAYPLYARAIAIRETAYGPDSPLVASVLLGHGTALRWAGRFADAEAKLGRALAIWQKAVGPDHLDTARALLALGSTHLARGRLREAERDLTRALAIDEKSLGNDHASLAPVLTSLGELHLRQHDTARATEVLERAVAIVDARQAHGQDAVRARFFLGQALWDAPGQRARARGLVDAARASYAALGEAGRSNLAEVDAFVKRSEARAGADTPR